MIVTIIGIQNSIQAQSALPSDGQIQAADSAITSSAIRAHVQFLADDLLEGRGPGTRGDELAMSYVQAQFKALGLKPAAQGDSWIQPVPLVGVNTRPPERIDFKTGEKKLTLKNYEQYIMTSGLAQTTTSFNDAEVVFVGYGIQAPEYNWDDFKDVDVAGKVLLIMNNDPAGDPILFAGSKRLYYGRWDYKYAKAAEMGAVGAFIIHTTESAGYPYQVVQTSWTGEQMRLGGSKAKRLPVEGWLTEDSARTLVNQAGKDLDTLRTAAERREFRPVPLGTTVSARLKSLVRNANTGNVLGLMPGSDPELSKQWVIFTAHHDHIGMIEKRDDKMDYIYNGAIDNASGVGVLLCIARAFANLPDSERPKRSILFASVGAEEQGLLGSQFLAENPPVPAGNLAAIMNIDGVNILGRTKDIVVIGNGKSDLDQTVQRIGRWQGRVVVPDQFPDQGYYYRSDQFSLAKVGVPGVYLGTGVHVIGKPDGWGKAKMREWNENVYHQVSDEYNEDWDLSGAVEDAKLMFHIGLQTANQPAMPAWIPGDEFEAARKSAIGAKNLMFANSRGIPMIFGMEMRRQFEPSSH